MTINDKIAHIEKVCTDYYGVTVDDVRGRSKEKHIVECRYIIWWYLYASGFTQAKIGKLYGGRNHSTISKPNSVVHLKYGEVLSDIDKMLKT